MKELLETCKAMFIHKKECASCEGHFQYDEQVYIDFTNEAYCEVCYKEKYSDFCENRNIK